MKKRPVILQNLGSIDYKAAWDLQEKYQKDLISYKRGDRKEETIHKLLFCEHNPVYTLGKSGKESHLLLNEAELKSSGIQFFRINRGGDITYHGPGQVVGYPILDLEDFYTDVHKYVRMIEQIIIDTLADFGIQAGRKEGFTGVWINGEAVDRKICAIGIHMSRWVSLHGFALNVNTDLKYFSNIIPCGIADQDKTVSSMEYELGKRVDRIEVMRRIAHHFQQKFDWEWSDRSDNNLLLISE